MDRLNPIDADGLKAQFRVAQPFPHMKIDNFLEEAFAEEIARSFPSFEEAEQEGLSFKALNERGKVQVTDSAKFPAPIRELHEILASEDFLKTLSHITGIDNLVADEYLVGGGIHETRKSGHLDVHIDFNFIKGRELHRRLNILVFFNKDWKEEYGGLLELWDVKVKNRIQAFVPVFNRCCVFETNDISWHGVTAVNCPENMTRKSFAGYYYTKEAPSHWKGEHHGTIFKARPNEIWKGKVQMPWQKFRGQVNKYWRKVERRIK